MTRYPSKHGFTRPVMAQYSLAENDNGGPAHVGRDGVVNNLSAPPSIGPKLRAGVMPMPMRRNSQNIQHWASVLPLSQRMMFGITAWAHHLARTYKFILWFSSTGPFISQYC